MTVTLHYLALQALQRRRRGWQHDDVFLWTGSSTVGCTKEEITHLSSVQALYLFFFHLLSVTPPLTYTAFCIRLISLCLQASYFSYIIRVSFCPSFIYMPKNYSKKNECVRIFCSVYSAVGHNMYFTVTAGASEQ